jgi:hypothetical protein
MIFLAEGKNDMIHPLFLLSFSLKTAFSSLLGLEFHECWEFPFACSLYGSTIYWKR